MSRMIARLEWRLIFADCGLPTVESEMQPRWLSHTHARARAQVFQPSTHAELERRILRGWRLLLQKKSALFHGAIPPSSSPLRALSTLDEHVVYENPVSQSSENHVESSGSQHDVTFSRKHWVAPMWHYCRAHMRTGLYDLFHGKQLPHLDPLHQPLDTLRAPRGTETVEWVHKRKKKKKQGGGRGNFTWSLPSLDAPNTDCALTRTSQLSILLIRNRTRIDISRDGWCVDITDLDFAYKRNNRALAEYLEFNFFISFINSYASYKYNNYHSRRISF